jgi:hypothetical protein
MSEVIGTCIAAIITIITSMDDINGPGAVSGVLVCISIVFAPCTGITKAIGVGCALTGICGAETIITNLIDGSGADGAELDVICIGCGLCADGTAIAGTTFELIGT